MRFLPTPIPSQEGNFDYTIRNFSRNLSQLPFFAISTYEAKEGNHKTTCFARNFGISISGETFMKGGTR